MKKYKICPYCGKRNLPKMLECIQCEADLSNVGVLDEEMEKKETESMETLNLGRMIRRCECGYMNVVNARKCRSCGEDISNIIPSVETQEMENALRCVLVSVDDEYVYEFSETSIMIGRESEMSVYLSNKKYVSRQHAELIRTNNRIYIKNLSQTNYTYVNNIKIPQELFELKDGDEIGLGGNSINGCRQQDAAYFQVRIGLCI